MNTDTQTFSASLLKQSVDHGQIVIREMHFGLYLSELGFMAKGIENGKRFDSCAAALAEVARLKLPSVEVVSIPESLKVFASKLGSDKPRQNPLDSI